MRLPDWVFRLLELAYRQQDRIRRTERRADLESQDARMRAYYADLRIRHDMGTCGGEAAGCCYVPCVPFVGWGIE